MGSPKGRKLGNWNTPEGWFLKAIINGLWKSTSDHSDENMGKLFFALMSQEVCQPIVMKNHPDLPVTAHMIKDRGDKGTRLGYEHEHPDKHPMGVKMLPFAEAAIKLGIQLTKEMVADYVARALNSDIQVVPLEKVTTNEKGIDGIIYINGTRSEKCNFGMTTKKDAEKRVQAFRKGDIENRMGLLHQAWVSDVHKVDRLLKKQFYIYHQGNERYSVPADVVWFYLKDICARHRIAIIPIMVDGIEIPEAAE